MKEYIGKTINEDSELFNYFTSIKRNINNTLCFKMCSELSDVNNEYCSVNLLFTLLLKHLKTNYINHSDEIILSVYNLYFYSIHVIMMLIKLKMYVIYMNYVDLM